MKDELAGAVRWQPLLDRMFEELHAEHPRSEVYWAQQLAFSPVFFFAVLLAVRQGVVSAADLQVLRKVVPLAMALLGALPDGDDGDANRLRLLALRQTSALGLGRRQHLARLAARLGLDHEPRYEPVPNRLLRPYEVIGWRPPGAA